MLAKGFKPLISHGNFEVPLIILFFHFLACTFTGSVDKIDDGPSSTDAEGAPTVEFAWYPDVDGDGYGDASAEATVASSVGSSTTYVTNNTDCDDRDADRHPTAVEICNGEDDNCDGEIDNAASDVSAWYLDLDGDGFGGAATVLSSCDGMNHFVNNSADCDDDNASIYPYAPESCNNVDDNCDGVVDERPQDGTTYSMDADGDGAGSAAEDAETMVACERPGLEWVPGNSDCDDANPEINSAADELCDGVDQDCDGEIDEGAVDATTWYGDMDADGFGDGRGWYVPPARSCEAPEGYIADGTDCDDRNGGVYPGSEEYCDWLDNDCDGFVDDEDSDGVADPSYWYFDMDGDSYGDPATGFVSCEFGAWSRLVGGGNITTDQSDCDDTDMSVPGRDSDADGYNLCTGDCDDRNWRASPDAIETHNGYDDDCDGVVDEEG